ncbi:murein hydrolase activator EnvC family protein [Megasphaera vaginalis (ex Bordigoni et al. 2020)]|uniref:murein hydrolase activator EnvC family protein n=2 Tax=Megasphaera TaxID=906 RepID=UPI003AF3231C
MMNYTDKSKKFLALFAAAVLLSPTVLSLAEDEDLQNQLSDVQSQMAVQQQKKSDAEGVITDVFERLRVIQERLDAAVSAYKSITAELTATEKKIGDAEREMAQAEERLKTRENVLSRRMRDIYMHGQLNYLDVVIGAKDFNDFANRVELLRRVISSDMSLISSIKEERSRIAAAKAVLEEERAHQQQLQADAAAKQAEIEKTKAEQQALLEKAQSDKATAEAALAELEATSQSIGAMLRQRQADRAAAASAGGTADSFQAVSGSGVFIWPVNGPITSPFGYRNHPIFGRAIFHSGIDIGVDEGTPVHAADAGVVVEADWLGGYGNAVIIDHGNGLSTVYGHNSSLAVSAGQSVAKGEVIAYAGSTGNSTGPHVHFEVRSGGEPVDPMGYL